MFFLLGMSGVCAKDDGQNEEDNDRPQLRGEIWYGQASWYGPRFHGKRTSNGEKFNKNRLTAAHPFLPFNTKLLVTNIKNNKSIVVRINDRGPFSKSRIIDLSEKAASRLNIKKQGIAYVKLQVVSSRFDGYRKRMLNRISGFLASNT